MLASRHLFAHLSRPVDHHDRHDDEDDDDDDGEDNADDGEDDDDDEENKHDHDEKGAHGDDTIKLQVRRSTIRS